MIFSFLGLPKNSLEMLRLSETQFLILTAILLVRFLGSFHSSLPIASFSPPHTLWLSHKPQPRFCREFTCCKGCHRNHEVSQCCWSCADPARQGRLASLWYLLTHPVSIYAAPQMERMPAYVWHCLTDVWAECLWFSPLAMRRRRLDTVTQWQREWRKVSLGSE